MGVHGLWKLIEPSGKPVPLETLENKVLAIDVSIWLHQFVKGFQDSKGSPLPNAHLLGVYHRLCKLLYFRIKPVFVFDGGVPSLKKETIVKRNQQKNKNVTETNRLQKQLRNVLLKHSAVNKVLSEKAKQDINEVDQMYVLPPAQLKSSESNGDNESDSTTEESSSPTRHWDLHTIDVHSNRFKSLPPDVRHEILTELKETRKQSSWGRLHELPRQSNDFATFQMQRLLKRYSVQTSLEEVEKEMGGHSLSLGELESLLNEQGVITKENIGKRIAADEETRYVFIKDLKQAINKAKNELETVKETETENDGDQEISENEVPKVSDLEYEHDLKRAIELSLQEEPSTSSQSNKLYSFIDTETSETDIELSQPKINSMMDSAKSYMLEYSGLTPFEIKKILSGNSAKKKSISNNKKSNTKITVDLENEAFTEVDDNLENKIKETETNIQNKLSSDAGKICDKKEAAIDEIFPSDSKETIDVKSLNESDSPQIDLTKSIDDETKILNENNMKFPKVDLSFENNQSFNSESASNLKEIEADTNRSPVQIISNSESDYDDDLMEVSSKKIEKQEIKSTKADTNRSPVQLISNSESDDDDLMEVSSEKIEKQEIKSTNNVMEIIIKNDGHLEDDIFEDIFCDKSNTSDININTNKSVDIENRDVIDRPVSCEHSLNIQSVEVKEDNKSNKKQEISASVLSTKDLKEMEKSLKEESKVLIAAMSSKDRLASNITDQMYQETQELLELFGVPYVIAPMEAEAQCAYLDEINLTDGTITDDSDIWLFGGKTVYKNFFEQTKNVMEFRAENIEHHFKLTREQMILLALLVGSDYTIGIHGIGPVTALEILAAFPPNKNNESYSHFKILSGLSEFRSWLCGSISKPRRILLRNKLRNVSLTENFPSLNVVKAYLEPTVETSRENFSWSKPDIVRLTDFAREKFGWSKTKSEEILKPVLKRLEETRVQKTIRDYFQMRYKIDSGELETKISKRIKSAIDKMGKSNSDSEEDEKPTNTQTKRKRTKNLQMKKQDLSSDEDVKVLKQIKKRSRQKNKHIESDINTTIQKVTKAVNLHKKEYIPQKEMHVKDVMRNKMKAIEVFRKSKKGPGYVKKREKVTRTPKADAELSESSSD